MSDHESAAAAAGPQLVRDLLDEFEGAVGPQDFGLTYRTYPGRLRDGAAGRYADGPAFGYRQDAAVYPASTCKSFYMVAFQHWVESGLLQADDEDLRALSAMIRQSSNDATTYLFGRMTDTTPGGPLPEADMVAWWDRRQQIHRYFQGWAWPDFAGLRLWHSTYEDSPYGREKAARAQGGNLIAPCAAAALLHGIVAGQLVSPAACGRMMELLDREPEREPQALPPDYRDQVRGFLGGGLPRAVPLWSKAGWTSETRHDMAYWEAPSGGSIVAAVYTVGPHMAQNDGFLPALGRRLLALLDR
jgi:beta-lactamase class A